MNSKFKITVSYLEAIGACHEGRCEFERTFPEGGAYQEVLDRCADEGRADFGCWLLEQLGPTTEIRTYDENISDPDKIIIFAGDVNFKLGVSIDRLIAGRSIEAGCGISAKKGIDAGRYIDASNGIRAGEGGIRAGWDIEAGWGIEAGKGIRAGEGIRAGWSIRANEGIEAGEGIMAGNGIDAGRSIEAGNGIRAGRSIRAGWGIRAGWNVKADEGIEAGDGIRAGKSIVAGKGYCIFAGLHVKLSAWDKHAVVSAKQKPENLISGHWVEEE